MEEALEKAFRRAGGNPVRQPSTYSLLGGYFSKEDLSRLFSGDLTVKESEARKELALKYLKILEEVPRGPERIDQLEALRAEFPAAVGAREGNNNGIVRFDLRFPMVTPIDKPKELWFDHAIVQETSPTYAEEVLEFLQDDRNLPENSFAFRKIVGSKVRRYGALMSVARKLAGERKLEFQPSFGFPVISALGFMNADMKSLLKLIVARFKDTQKTEPRRLDGKPLAVIKGRFKAELKNSICFALLKGNALAVHNQGTTGVVKPP